jgi:hypothetical protein
MRITSNRELAMKTAWLGILAVFAAFGLFASAGSSQGVPESEQQFKHVRLTEKHLQGYISAQKDLAPLASKLESSGDQPDPALQAQLQQIATSNGFSGVDELAEVEANIAIVLAGLDPQTGQFTEPPDLIRKDMEQVKRDTKMSQQDKDQALSEMQEALKTATPLKFKENVALVKKYQKDLAIGQEPEQQGPTQKN